MIPTLDQLHQLLITAWVDRVSVEYKVCPTILHMASTGNRTPDLRLSPYAPSTWPHALMLLFICICATYNGCCYCRYIEFAVYIRACIYIQIMKIKYILESQMVECSMKSFIHTQSHKLFFCIYLQICFVRIIPHSAEQNITSYLKYISITSL